MSILEFLLGKRNTNKLKMSKSNTGEWIVRKVQSVVYIGSKEKCQTYLDFHMTS